MVVFLMPMHSKAKAAVCIGTALPAIAVAAHGCQDPTQVTLDVRTNVVCSDAKGVEIVVATTPHQAETRAALVGGGVRFATATTRDCSEGATPRRVGTLVVTPGDDDDNSNNNQAAVVVLGSFGKTQVEACLGSSFPTQCIVARRRFTFVDHVRVLLPILLDPICAGVPCDETSTCVGAKCVPSDVRCESGTCTEPGVAPDGGLVVVDAQGPINVTPVDDSGPNSTNEGGTATDAGRDAKADADASSFNDGGMLTGNCPNPETTCSGNPVSICTSPSICCYVGVGASCETAQNCDREGGCCRGAQDCGVGQVCCASTPAPSGPNTRFSCLIEQACVQSGGVAICSKAIAEGCGSKQCIGGRYSTNPDFFKCS